MTTSKEIIDRCRKVPIHKIVGLTNFSRRAKIRCPFHADRTASCTLFPTGGFHCFGCGANGNSVDFIINMGESFETAINELTKYI